MTMHFLQETHSTVVLANSDAESRFDEKNNNPAERRPSKTNRRQTEPCSEPRPDENGSKENIKKQGNLARLQRRLSLDNLSSYDLKLPQLTRRCSDGMLDHLNTDLPRRGSSGRMQRRGSAYAGPTPLGPGGSPLKSCLSSSNASADTSPARSVSFTTIQVRKYERDLGDNPCISSGPPITLGWRYNQYMDMPIHEYEKARGDPLAKEQLRIPADIRVGMILDQTDHNIRNIKDAELQAKKYQAMVLRSRRAAMKTFGTQQVQEIRETARRKLRRFTTGRTKQKEEEELWEKAQVLTIEKYLASFTATATATDATVSSGDDSFSLSPLAFMHTSSFSA